MKWPWTKKRLPEWKDGIDCPVCDYHYDSLPPLNQMTIRCVQCSTTVEIIPNNGQWEIGIRDIEQI